MARVLPFGYWKDPAWQEEQRAKFRRRFRLWTNGAKVTWYRESGPWIPRPSHGDWFTDSHEAQRDIEKEVDAMLEAEIQAHRFVCPLGEEKRPVAMTWLHRLWIWRNRRQLNQPYEPISW